MLQRMKGLLIITLACSGVQATELNITGDVLASACIVESSSANQEIDFEQLRSTDLKEAGSNTDWKPFTIKLVNCPVTTRQATVMFTGNPDRDDPTLYANNGTAKNIAVQLVTEADKTAVKGDKSKLTVPVTAEHSALFSLAGRLYSVKGNASSGTFNSLVQLSFTYN